MQKQVKAALRSGKVTTGSWVTSAHTAVAEIMAKRGFDWLA
jgi:2-keto-3-deoxy-L-rhamnonate aldolase RhmA